MRFLIAVCCFISFSSQLFAQVSINANEAILQMLDKEKQVNKSITTISGWSIQILSSDDRNKVTELKGVFLNTYPNTIVDWDYEAPYYKLRAGAYRTKPEATRLLYKIKNQFPDAYVVRNNKISPLDLL